MFMINVNEKEQETKMCMLYKTNYGMGGKEGGREEKREREKRRDQKEIYQNVNKASKLQLVHFKHVVYYMSTISQ